MRASYPSQAAAIADVEAAGFKQSDKFPQFWTKPSTNTFGAPTLAIVEIVEQIVAPVWGQPNYFTVEFK